MLTGLLFVMTAFSYAEATTIFPEAGGSSSFARHTFNEFVSFGAGWALMLDYIITIAISAFFVPNYLATFWPILKTWPYNSIGGVAIIVFLVVINIFGIKEAARLNIILAIADLSTQVLLALVGPVRLSVAPAADHPDPLRYGTDGTPVHLRHLDRHGGLHGHRDHLQHGRGVVQPGPRCAQGGQVRAGRRARRVLRYLDGRSVGHADHNNILPVNPQTHMTIPEAILPDPGKEVKTGPWHFAAHPVREGLHAAELEGTATCR